jgi:hypothetical protein
MLRLRRGGPAPDPGDNHAEENGRDRADRDPEDPAAEERDHDRNDDEGEKESDHCLEL